MFPATKLDFLEPSARAYYEPLVDALKERKVPSRHLDLCVAMSLQGTAQLGAISGEIAGMF
jgi:hypothetical protein